MRITWYGHAAFLIETAGLRVIMDPYGECGYQPINDTADIVAISHDNEKYHSCTKAISGDFELVHGLRIPVGGAMVREVPFSAMEVYEDTEGTGPNAMISFVSEGLKVSHMGDLGHALNDVQTAFLDGTDILLALAGGPPTIALPDLKTLIDHIQPAVTIPMHMGTPAIDMNLQPIDDTIALFPPERVQHSGPSYEVILETLPQPGTLVVLPYTR